MDEQARLAWVRNYMDARMADIDDFIARKTERSPWQPWFAWRPVTIRGKWVWLQKIYRRNHDAYVDNGKFTRQEYGTMFDVIKGD